MCERATVKIREKVALIATERGSQAIVPLDKLCKLVERLQICLDDPRIKC